MTPPYREAVRQLLHEIETERVRRDMTRADMQKRSGLSKQTVSRYLNPAELQRSLQTGAKVYPDMVTILCLCHAVGIEILPVNVKNPILQPPVPHG